MRSLVMDRSSGRPGMAVFEDRELVFEKAWDVDPTRAPGWLADMDQALAGQALPVAAFDRFVCGLGPGSFSGIRACLAALQGMALPGGKPVSGVASAAALALGQSDGAEYVTVVGDARRSRLWSITYRVNPAAPHRVLLADGRRPTHTAADFALTPAEALAEVVPEGTRIVTSDWGRLSAVLSGMFAAERLVPQALFPSASDLGRVALADPDACVFEPVPVYLHPAVAVHAP
ncbi:MAG TPA: tRNA (adenosine(37)-N6)-threonylcarbamoyltransferase complex dimerization subunit type 1 TsaB [Kiritimatiellia bacterium]|nr:tRNA (adenosine(37)-N6)-threonylcarbamoyltransferase complex dimerization subunit type 1 TsaB [Kiritimatiellia bacterium]HPS06963.1 tRNA (adenosine(37)-N6)-threonylcarbamoyltransferase complex dimerization subunit type 1 TsaB [Kiritimatiellia bacterium]